MTKANTAKRTKYLNYNVCLSWILLLHDWEGKKTKHVIITQNLKRILASQQNLEVSLLNSYIVDLYSWASIKQQIITIWLSHYGKWSMTLDGWAMPMLCICPHLSSQPHETWCSCLVPHNFCTKKIYRIEAIKKNRKKKILHACAFSLVTEKGNNNFSIVEGN